MARSTRATLALTQAGVAFALYEYDYDPRAKSIGLQAAEALGVTPNLVFKTLITTVDNAAVCAVIPSDCELSLKRLAAFCAAKSAVMMPPTDAARTTGYVIGGISPLGQKRDMPVIIDQAAQNYDAIYINGGRRGLQILINPRNLVKVLGAQTHAVTTG